MWRDPIVEEIHAVRRRIARECKYDLRRIVERLRKKEKRHKERLTFSKPGATSETREEG